MSWNKGPPTTAGTYFVVATPPGIVPTDAKLVGVIFVDPDGCYVSETRKRRRALSTLTIHWHARVTTPDAPGASVRTDTDTDTDTDNHNPQE